MSEANLETIPYGELKSYAEYAVDWCEARGFTLTDVLDARKESQDRGLLKGIVWAQRRLESMTVEEMQKFNGMNGRVGTEA